MQLLERETSVCGRATAADEGEAIYARVERYLFALGLQDKTARNLAMSDIRERASRRAVAEPSLPLSAAVHEALEEAMQQWWEQLAPEGSGVDTMFCSSRERMALLIAHLPADSHCHFLQPGEVSPQLSKMADGAFIPPHPDLQRAAMVPQPLDLGPMSALAAIGSNPFFRLATGAAWLFGLIVAVVFLFNHL